MSRHRRLLCAAAATLLTGCATIGTGSPYVGRPIAEAIKQLGAPQSVADYQHGGRVFSWSTSDVLLFGPGADDPANWTTPGTLRSDDAPRFEPGPCSLTLVATWDAARAAWIAQKAIERGAGAGGQCGMRLGAQ